MLKYPYTLEELQDIINRTVGFEAEITTNVQEGKQTLDINTEVGYNVLTVTINPNINSNIKFLIDLEGIDKLSKDEYVRLCYTVAERTGVDLDRSIKEMSEEPITFKEEK